MRNHFYSILVSGLNECRRRVHIHPDINYINRIIKIAT